MHTASWFPKGGAHSLYLKTVPSNLPLMQTCMLDQGYDRMDGLRLDSSLPSTPYAMCSSYFGTTFLLCLGSEDSKCVYMSQTIWDSDTGYNGGISTIMLILYISLCSIEVPSPSAPTQEANLIWARVEPQGRRLYHAAPSRVLEGETKGQLGGGSDVKGGYNNTGSVRRKKASIYDETVDLGGEQLTILNEVVGRGLHGAVSAGR